MKRYILILAMGFACMLANGQKLQKDEFAKANAYYNDSKYDSAMITYNRIIDEGYVSAQLYYNIGNTYFKLRNIPMSIYYYECALKHEPNNKDIKNNLSVANALITDKIEPLPVFFMTRWWRNAGNILSADGWATCSIIVFAILLTALFLYITARTKAAKKSMFFTTLVALVIFVASVVFAANKSRYMKSNDEAIIMKPTITVKSSPSSSGVDLFVLHEGTKVEIEENEGNWNKIKIADGSVGWLPEDAMLRF
ncbi:MAG: hypothetical protein MJZ47_00515 [Bacteroidales bacterium]|nr:hypothetical protein [Bacteroidales bacterium]